jgi:hypothetical protein
LENILRITTSYQVEKKLPVLEHGGNSMNPVAKRWRVLAPPPALKKWKER